MTTQLVYITLAAFALTLAAIYLVSPIANKVGLVDKPCERKRHNGEIPLTGGIAIFLGVVCTTLFVSKMPTPYHGIFAAVILLLILGIADDYRNLPAKYRLIIQFAAGLIIALGSKITLQSFGNLFSFGEISLGIFAVPVTAFCIVGVINATNMIDGIDGLAGGLSAITLATLGYLSISSGSAYSQLILATLGAVCGFLTLNARSPIRKHAKIFMGDSGSMVLGCIIAAMLISMSQGPHRAIRPVTALWVFAIPLMDTIGLIIRRLTKGQSPLSAGRDHIHHILQQKGLGVQQTVSTLTACALCLAAIGVLGEKYKVSEGIMFLSFATIFALYLGFIVHSSRLSNEARNEHANNEIPVTIQLSPLNELLKLEQHSQEQAQFVELLEELDSLDDKGIAAPSEKRPAITP